MARMIPAEPQSFNGSDGERRVFQALRCLRDDVTVFYSLRWLHAGQSNLPRHLKAQGEGDFVVFDPRCGVLVLEVKGGEIRCESGQWLQRNRRTGTITCIDPEAQASSTKFRIMQELQDRVSGGRKILVGHGVWFPDGEVDRRSLPMNYHPSTTLDGTSIHDVERAISEAFRYWSERFPAFGGTDAARAKTVVSVLAPSLAIVRSVRQPLDEREELLVQLTREQSRVLEFLDEQMHAAVIGAAGTGKTLLAVEKARRLATPTEPVLFLCYNAALRDHLRERHAQPDVRYHTFHGFARQIAGSEGDLEAAERRLLDLLADAADLPYAHLIVDEAQDFKRDWLELLRYRFRDAAFYAFYDRFQAVQGDKETSLLDDIPCRLALTRNCRNTDPVAKCAYRAGNLPLAPTLGVAGPLPRLHVTGDAQQALSRAESLLRRVFQDYKEPPERIAILSMESLDESGPWRASKLGGVATSDTPRTGRLTVTTVRKFKGLEASLVILVNVDFRKASDDEWRRLLYIGLSRARQAAHIITTNSEAEVIQAVSSLSASDRVRPSLRALFRQLGLLPGDDNSDPFAEP